jgi:acyl carrier protein
MSNETILRVIFSESLAISTEEVIDSLEYNTIPKWDSLGHMSIVAKIEDTFNIMLDIDDILDMNSFGKAKEILSKYDVEF